MLNGDASSHPFHSLPPPPPPPPHSHQTLFSSFGYHRLSPSSADEPRYGQGSSPLASCSRWISFFSFSVCIESFLSARPLPPLPRGVCTRLRAGVRKRACGRACGHVHVRTCAHAGACMCVCVCAWRQGVRVVCAGVCTQACHRPPPLHAPSSAAAALCGPRLRCWHIPPSPPRCPRLRGRAGGSTVLPMAPAHPVGCVGTPRNTLQALCQGQGWAARCPAGSHGCRDPLPTAAFPAGRLTPSEPLSPGRGCALRVGRGCGAGCFPRGCPGGWLSTGSAQLNPGDRPRGTGR